MNRYLKLLIFVLAVVYFLVDAVFVTVARPMAGWIGERGLSGSVRAWIVSLRPYPTLAVFAVPLIVLEPVKPLAVYLVGSGHMALGLVVLVVGELLKLVLVERLFSISRDKLMSIAAFAWAYGRYRRAMDWLQSLKAWQAARRLVRTAVRGLVRQAKAFQRRECVLFQSR